MTAAALRKPAPLARPRLTPAGAGLRLVRLHLASRSVPMTLAVLAACAAVLRAALWRNWAPHPGPQQLPLAIEAGTAMVIAVTTRSPFGEPERITGRWLPYLRLSTALALTGTAAGVLAAASAGAHLPDGDLAMLRNTAGLAGIALLSAAVLGGSLAWITPVVYWLVTEFALSYGWQTPWIWPARPPHDRGAAICAALVFAAGVIVTTVRGARDSARE
ncbi:hypothetical protein [Rugosimonospora africana]|uniref:Uncharacterized protein n=1 Tax=Rugosimonospora africana TaxID=556532 RepID=A0A8J3R191_9ACTN|nr:hypothetical protein [Rugosimonospora africana]GIH21184.1 hypothetical protein Raf01_93560 [Rugosimonospora africana]